MLVHMQKVSKSTQNHINNLAEVLLSYDVLFDTFWSLFISEQILYRKN